MPTLGWIFLTLAIALPLVLSSKPASTGKRRPEVLEVETAHAWCYVVVNNPSVLDKLDMISCVPKEKNSAD